MSNEKTQRTTHETKRIVNDERTWTRMSDEEKGEEIETKMRMRMRMRMRM